MKNSEWTVQIVAGTGEQGYSGDGASALSAQLNNPFDMALSFDGILIFSDTFSHCLRRIGIDTGLVGTICGIGECGFAGDGGPATRAQLNEPYGVAADAAGLLEPNGLALSPDRSRWFIADIAGHRVRVVDLGTGIIATAAGTGAPPYRRWRTRHQGRGLWRSGCRLCPGWVAVRHGAAGKLHPPQSRWHYRNRRRNRRPGYTGDGGDARFAVFDAPEEMAVDPSGNIYVADSEHRQIRRLVRN